MKKITLFLFLSLMLTTIRAQVILIQENFQNWTAQATSGAYTISKTLADGTTGSFTADKLVVAPSQSTGTAGTLGGVSPSTGRVVIGSTAGYLELPALPSVGNIQIKANIGTAQRTMKLQVKNGAVYSDIPNTTVAVSKDSILQYNFNLTYSSSTIIRIVTSNSSLNIWDLKVSSYVSALPQLPNAPQVGNASLVTAETFQANWAPVANAAGYIVKLYNGATLVGTYTATGQSTSGLIIGGLLPQTSYTYTVAAKGDGVSYTDSDFSSASALFSTTIAPASISTDFNDGTWGVASATAYTTGAYPSSSVNGYDLVAAGLYVGTSKGPKGETHTNRIAIDKSSYGGKVILPMVNSIQQIEIHGAAGTAGNGFSLREYNSSTSSWDLIGTYTYDAASKNAGLDSIYVISISRSVPTKLRIENSSAGGFYLWKVATRTTNPVTLSRPVVSAATQVTGSGFVANWAAVTNATAYKINVYNYGSLKNTFTVNDPLMTSYTINGLDTATVCTYKVQALGDGDVNYSDSYLSFYTSPLSSFSIVRLLTPQVLAVSDVSETSFTANWQAVVNASAYRIDVYKDGVFQSNFTTINSTDLSIAVTGLTGGSQYTYTVTALGDQLSTFDSYPSSSAQVTTNDVTTGLKSSTDGSDLALVNGCVYSSEVGTIEVVGMNGQCIKKGDKITQLDVKGLKGIYLIRFKGIKNNQKVKLLLFK